MVASPQSQTMFFFLGRGACSGQFHTDGVHYDLQELFMVLAVASLTQGFWAEAKVVFQTPPFQAQVTDWRLDQCPALQVGWAW